jgi:hypothetical protein
MEHLSEWHQWADTRIKKHDKDMYEGNGKPAITVRLDRVEQFVESAKYRMNAVILLLVGAILTGLVDMAVRAHGGN